MKMNNKPLIQLVLMLLLLPVVVTAQVGTSDEDKLTQQEKRELVAFTKRFVARMQKTRDVRPLRKVFLLPLRDLRSMFASKLVEEGGHRPTGREAERLALVLSNLIYASTVADIVSDKDNGIYSVHGIVPERLAKTLDENVDKLLDCMDVDCKDSFPVLLSRVEHYSAAVRRHLIRKNFETSAKYKRVIREREKEVYYNYDINQIYSTTDDDDNEMDDWFRSFGPETRVYLVGTPQGIGVMVRKLKRDYRVIFLWPHPFTDDR